MRCLSLPLFSPLAASAAPHIHHPPPQLALWTNPMQRPLPVPFSLPAFAPKVLVVLYYCTEYLSTPIPRALALHPTWGSFLPDPVRYPTWASPPPPPPPIHQHIDISTYRHSISLPACQTLLQQGHVCVPTQSDHNRPTISALDLDFPFPFPFPFTDDKPPRPHSF